MPSARCDFCGCTCGGLHCCQHRDGVMACDAMYPCFYFLKNREGCSTRICCVSCKSGTPERGNKPPYYHDKFAKKETGGTAPAGAAPATMVPPSQHVMGHPAQPAAQGGAYVEPATGGPLPVKPAGVTGSKYDAY